MASLTKTKNKKKRKFQFMNKVLHKQNMKNKHEL